MVQIEVFYLSDYLMAIHDGVDSSFSLGSNQLAVNPRPRLVHSALSLSFSLSKMMGIDLSWNEFTEKNCNIFLFKDKFQE